MSSGARRPRLRCPASCSACALLLVYTAFGVSADTAKDMYIEDTDRFPGWKGELPRSAEEDGPNTIGYGEGGVEEWRGEVEQVSWSPRAFLYKKFLSEEECDHLINHAKKRMTKSTVVDNETGKSVDSTVRTSTGTFYGRGEDEIIARIERRISHISFLPVENGEGLQILHYVDGEKYEPHHDFFHDTVNARPENGGQRIATVLIYLTTPEEGGETVFPKAGSPAVTGPQWSDCARKGLAVKAVRGNALLFYSLKPNGETDFASMHGSCPVTKGEKFSATKWIHVGEFGRTTSFQAAKWGECVDGEERCPAWAAAGECSKNAKYMLTYCRKSCKACKPADAGDADATAR